MKGVDKVICLSKSAQNAVNMFGVNKLLFNEEVDMQGSWTYS